MLHENAPKSMVDALDADDPFEALMAISKASEVKAEKLANELDDKLANLQLDLPDVLKTLPNPQDMDSHPVSNAMACADAILNSLTKIASGGSQASQEIQQLEQEKREMEEHAQDVETALVLRKASDIAAQSLSAQRYEAAAQAIRDYLEQQQRDRLTERARAYAGEYTVTQLESSQKGLRAKLLEDYQEAVEQSNLRKLGQLTPLVQQVQMEQEAVALYLRFLKGILSKELGAAAASDSANAKPPPYVPMGRVYNTAVTLLRHHLPMVSHCLHRADGDAAVVRLIHLQVEQAVGPLLKDYIREKNLPTLARDAQDVYNMMEERYSGHQDYGRDDGIGGAVIDDCKFSSLVGSMADVDSAMEEAALCLQHAESYTRFIDHTVREVNKARGLRFQKEAEQRRSERERKEWATGMSSSSMAKGDSPPEEYVPIEILPAQTQLYEDVAEVGGYYSAVERCLLLASMQRSFAVPEDNPTQFSLLGAKSNSGAVATRALQTSMVETCLYAARRGSQRAFATGHTGTASAMANYCADCLRGVLVEYMSRRAEDWGVGALKPGEGLLEGSAGIFNATSLMRQGQTVSHAVGGAKVDEAQRRYEVEQGISWACATLNDLDVAAHHTQELEKVLAEAVERGFPKDTHGTEQLKMCVKSLTPVAESFKLASENAIESLVSVLKSRIRNLVSDSVGVDGSAAGFSSVMVGSKTTDRLTVRMNYNLDEETYNMLEISEGYISSMCSHLDVLMLPLRLHLSPRLSDLLVLGVLGAASKRLEAAIKKCHFTSLGALSLDSDMRDFLNYAKEKLDAHDLNSNIALYRACTPLARLLQIAKLLNVDDLEDVVDLISASKRKGNWDLSLEDAKAFLSLRVDFEESRVNELLRIPDDD